MARTWFTQVVVALLTISCSSTPPAFDASVDGGIAGRLRSIAVLPAPPDFGECPQGWRRVVRDEARVCDPWPDSGMEDCDAPDAAHFPGGAGCEQIGTECVDDYAEGLPAGAVFVRAGAPTGGDGSRLRPFATVAAALSATPDGGVLALSRGLFVQDFVDLPADVAIVGACVAETVLRSEAPSPEGDGVVVVTTIGGELRNLRIEGSRPGISVRGGELTLNDVVIAGAEGAGVLVSHRGRVQGRRLVVRDTSANGWGAGVGGDGVVVAAGSALSLEHGVMERNSVGVLVSGAEATAVLSDLAVRDSVTDPLGGSGWGLLSWEGGHIQLRRAAIDHVRHAGVRVGNGGWMDVDVAVIRDVVPEEVFGRGAGIIAEGGGVTATRVWIERATHAGVVVTEFGSTLTLRDLLVHDTRVPLRAELGPYGIGVRCDAGAMLELERVAIVRAAWGGLVAQLGCAATVADLIVRDTPGVLGHGGRGLELTDATAVVRRALFQRNHDAAVSAIGNGTSLDATDLTVRDTSSGPELWAPGHGIHVAEAAVAVFSRADVAGSRGLGLAAFGPATTVSATDARIAEIGELECADTTCAERSYAYGAGSYDGASLRLIDFVIERTGRAGLQLASGGEASLLNGTISSVPVGINLQSPDLDTRRLREGVTFQDVDVDLDSSGLPLASAISAHRL